MIYKTRAPQGPFVPPNLDPEKDPEDGFETTIWPDLRMRRTRRHFQIVQPNVQSFANRNYLREKNHEPEKCRRSRARQEKRMRVYHYVTLTLLCNIV